MGLISLFIRIGLMAAADSGPKPVTKEEGQALEDSFDKREHDANFEQLAGRKCRQCKYNIVAQPEGQLCPTCGKPIHRACAEKHLAKCGAPESPPYR
jgi:hypothetical protein